MLFIAIVDVCYGNRKTHINALREKNAADKSGRAV
jgi:hypothetical protein